MAAIVCLSLPACGKEAVVTQSPGTLTLVQGNLQAVQGGLDLPNPVVVRLLDTQGAPIAKTAVGFSVILGGGAVNPGSALTDENGEARTKWTVGTGDVNQILQAKVAGLDPLTINATALLPSDLAVAQGGNQSARPSAALPNPLVVRVLGPNNAPMKNVTVAFQVITGGGLISPQSALTNATGEVTARWTQSITVTATAVP
jgi:hypothetical protein